MSWSGSGVRVLAVAAALSFAGVCVPAMAGAAEGWVWPAGSRVALGFGQEWRDDAGRTCSHGGVDLAAPAGESVLAPVGGRVAFAGSVPAAGGGRTLAVTLETDDGLKVTCMPLEDCCADLGGRVEPGDRLGSLAESGDGSLAEAHVHLSVRRGGVAMDPEPFLTRKGATLLAGDVGVSAGGPTGPPVRPPAAPALARLPVPSSVARRMPVRAWRPSPSRVRALRRALASAGAALRARRLNRLHEVPVDRRESVRAGKVWSVLEQPAVTACVTALAALLLVPVLRGGPEAVAATSAPAGRRC